MDAIFDLNVIKASYAANQQQFAEQANRLAADQFEQDAKNWAQNVLHTGIRKPPPIAPRKMEAVVEFAENGTFSAVLKQIASPVSSLDPESLLTGAPGDAMHPVGKQIPASPGCYFSTSEVSPFEGQVIARGGRRFKFVKYFFGLGGFWMEVS